ncbi:hypothetical protein D7Y09_13625 [bacterium 1XD42-1]|nr:hypothetical protein D7Y09_13625 [bacterium 1XD42-1]
MLKVSLKQFMGLGLLVDDMMEKYNISYDLVPYIELYIGDPDKNGDITIDFKGPRSLFNSSKEE